MPEVSIIIPTYNHARYLPDAITSVLAQSFDDWEAIIVDDGSTDDTPAVIGELHDHRLRAIRQNNQGLSAARNTGIRHAQGRYLAFLDADDGWYPGFLQRCLSILRSDATLAAVFTRNHFVDEQRKTLPQIGGRALPPSQVRAQLIQGGFFACHALLLRADALETIGLFDTSLTSLEDWDLWLRLSATQRMLGIEDVLVWYRLHQGNMSADGARMQRNRLAVVAKHFGPETDAIATWSEEKRAAYAFAYRAAALDAMQMGQLTLAWQYLSHGASLWPPLLQRLDTLYELACGNQPRGWRPPTDLQTIRRNEAMLVAGLERVGINLHLARSQHCHVLGQTYYALTILAEEAGEWAAACAYLRQALRADISMLRQPSVIRRLLKLAAGPGLLHALRTHIRKSAHPRLS